MRSLEGEKKLSREELAIPWGGTQQDLMDYIVKNGCYAPEENLRIYKKFFTMSRPRDQLYRALAEKYALDNKTVCDVGCSYGMHLIRCTAGSYGLEIEKYPARFAQSIGLDVYERNVIDDALDDLPKTDVVWSTAVMEHTDSPHIFLRKLYGLLKDSGLLIIEVPAIPTPPRTWLGKLPIRQLRNTFGKEDTDDHINAFSPTTLQYFCERAGFETSEVFLWSRPIVKNWRTLPALWTRFPPFSVFAIDCVFIGKKIPGWDYGPKASRRAAQNVKGYVFKSQTATNTENADD
ncbi:MAG: class I SAM-dependent methyltransferase [Anaerolineae bacterium]|nr:class I SAM-dependent methyltransferase [Anaerolineae bacterium]